MREKVIIYFDSSGNLCNHFKYKKEFILGGITAVYLVRT